MQVTKRILFIISILIFIQSYLCQQEQDSKKLLNDGNNNTLSFNETLSIGKLLNTSYVMTF